MVTVKDTLRFTLTPVMCLALSVMPASAADIYATQLRSDSAPPTNFQLLLELGEDGSLASTGPVFAPLLGIFGLAFLDGTLYGSEFDAGDYHLVTMAHEGFLRGQGQRVSNNTIVPASGPIVEGLAVGNGVIYGSALDFAAHRTTLHTIDKVSGIGTPLGAASRNVMIVGMAYDPIGNKLYGAGVPFGAGEATAVNENNLYTLDVATGAETLVGPLGVHIEGLAWDQNLGLIGVFETFYQIDTATGTATALGSLDLTDGKPGTFNGSWALAALLPPGFGETLCGDANGDSNRSAGDALVALLTGVGADSCEACICDVNGLNGINATDALLILQFGVGQPITLSCPSC